jgi:hypothetical protein
MKFNKFNNFFILKMSTGKVEYFKHSFKLTDNQLKNIINSIKSKEPIVLKITKDSYSSDSSGNLITLPLTKNDASKVEHNKAFDYQLNKSKLKLIKVEEKEGGFFPLLIPILAAVSAAAGVGTVASTIAKTVNEKKSNDALLNETERHNRVIEEAAKGGAISLMKPVWKNGTSIDVKEFVNKTKLDNVGKKTLRSFLKNLHDNNIEMIYDGKALSLRPYLNE